VVAIDPIGTPTVLVDTVAVADSRLDMGYSYQGPYGLVSHNADIDSLPGYELDISDLPDDRVSGKGSGVWVDVLDLDFKPRYFNFFGSYVGEVFICSNGFVSFSSEAWDGGPWVSAEPQDLPDSDAPNGVVAGLWRDLYFDPGAGSKIRYGPGPYGSFYVCWINMRNTYDNELQTFGLIFFPWQGTGIENCVELVMKEYSPLDGTRIGLEDFGGTRGVCLPSPTGVPPSGQYWQFIPDVSNDYRVKSITIYMAIDCLGDYVTIEGPDGSHPGGMNIDEYAGTSRDDAAFVCDSIMSALSLSLDGIELGALLLGTFTTIALISSPVGAILLATTAVTLSILQLVEAFSPSPSDDEDENEIDPGEFLGQIRFPCRDDFNDADPLDVVGPRPWTCSVHARLNWRVPDIAMNHRLNIWAEAEFVDRFGTTDVIATEFESIDGGIELRLLGENAVSTDTQGSVTQVDWEGRTYPDGNYYRFAPTFVHVSGAVGYYVDSFGTARNSYDVMGWNKLAYDSVHDHTSSDGALYVSGYFMLEDDLPEELRPAERKLNLYIFYSTPDSYSYDGFLHEAPDMTVQILGGSHCGGMYYFEQLTVSGLEPDRNVKVAIGRPVASNPAYYVHAEWSAVFVGPSPDPEAPSVTVLCPNGGETWCMGETYDVRWTSVGVEGLVKVALFMDGSLRRYIESSAINDGVCTWTVDIDLTEGHTYTVAVLATEPVWLTDQSDAYFSILEPTPWIIVTTPESLGETWYYGETHRICWYAPFVDGTVSIDLLGLRNGNYYHICDIASQTENDGSCDWVVPTLSDLYYYAVRVTSDSDTGIYGQGNDFLLAHYPLILVQIPNGGQVWYKGGTYDIYWWALTVEEPFAIALTKAGEFCRYIDPSAFDCGYELCSYTWTIGPDLTSGTDYGVTISAMSPIPVSDHSNAYFSIIDPPDPDILVTAPNGGEEWEQGRQYIISWASIGFPGDEVRVELLKAGQLHTVITESTPNDGKHYWTMPLEQELGTDYQVVVSSTSTSASDISDGYFSIVMPHSWITVLSPNGGESWEAGATYDITWTTGGEPIDSVSIELYGGGTISTIGYSEDDGLFTWTIPTDTEPGSDYFVRIGSNADGYVRDFSDCAFSIVEPEPTITVTSPNGGEVWLLGTYHLITWTYTGNPGDYVRITLYKSSVPKLTIAVSAENTGSFGWTIPTSLKRGTDYQVEISSTSTPAYDVSDSYFTLKATSGGGGGPKAYVVTTQPDKLLPEFTTSAVAPGCSTNAGVFESSAAVIQAVASTLLLVAILCLLVICMHRRNRAQLHGSQGID